LRGISGFQGINRRDRAGDTQARPQSEEGEPYSGKKKRHTVKIQLTVNGDGLIVHRTKLARGRRHDYD
jgi:hypothetical protein